MSAEVVDLFAGPGGWSEGLASLGMSELGIDNDVAACATAEAAGHKRLQADIHELSTDVAGPAVRGVIASPPCPGFSAAGKGLGRKDLEMLLARIDEMAWGRDSRAAIETARQYQHDPRSALTLEPLRWVLDLEPEWVALEQVPQVLPLWQAYAEVLRLDGYHVWTGLVQAEQYGVPQTRKRAVLMASRDTVAPPVPTHSRYYSRSPQKLDEGVAKWVSMAEALSWGMTDRPSMTVTGGGTSTGGAEPFGNAARQGMLRERDAGRWVLAKWQGAGMVARNGARPPRTMDQPAFTMAGLGGSGSGSLRWRPIPAIEGAARHPSRRDRPRTVRRQRHNRRGMHHRRLPVHRHRTRRDVPAAHRSSHQTTARRAHARLRGARMNALRWLAYWLWETTREAVLRAMPGDQGDGDYQ